MKVADYKLKMKSLISIPRLHINADTIVTAKADGDFNLYSYNRNGESCTINRWNTKRTNLPCLLALTQALDRQQFIQTAKLLLELYAVENGKMLKLPKYLHHVKTGDINKVRAGIFDLISINGNRIPHDYGWKLDEMKSWLDGTDLCHVLPYIHPKTVEDVKQFWNLWVVGRGYEGLVARNGGDIYKIKKHANVDAVVIGINKRPKLADKQVTSLRLALMDKNGNFVELGDVASGIDHALRSKLYNFIDTFKISEDKDTIYIKPFLIVEIKYTETYDRDRNIFTIENDGRRKILGTRKFYSLREPRLVRFRTDKTVNPTDLRLEQIAEG